MERLVKILKALSRQLFSQKFSKIRLRLLFKFDNQSDVFLGTSLWILSKFMKLLCWFYGYYWACLYVLVVGLQDMFFCVDKMPSVSSFFTRSDCYQSTHCFFFWRIFEVKRDQFSCCRAELWTWICKWNKSCISTFPRVSFAGVHTFEASYTMSVMWVSERSSTEQSNFEISFT